MIITDSLHIIPVGVSFKVVCSVTYEKYGVKNLLGDFWCVCVVFNCSRYIKDFV